MAPPLQPGWAPGGFTEDTLVTESAGCVGRARLGRWDHPGRDKEASSGLALEEAVSPDGWGYRQDADGRGNGR